MRILKIEEKQFNIIETKDINNNFIIIFQKGDISLPKIQDLLNKCYSSLSPIDINTNGDPHYTYDNLEISTDFWKLKSIEEKDDCFELVLAYKIKPTPIEILSAKLDYLAIMSDIELQEV